MGLRFVFDELIHEERLAIPHRKRIVLEPVAEDDDTLVATQRQGALSLRLSCVCVYFTKFAVDN